MYKKASPILRTLTVLVVLCSSSKIQSQVGINTITPGDGSMLDIKSANKGLLVPRVAILDLSTIDPVVVNTAAEESLLVYNTSIVTGKGFYYWDGSMWVKLSTGDSDNDDWKINGNAGTNASTNFLGTTDNIHLNFRTNNARRMELDTFGTLTINPDNTATSDPLDVNGDVEIGGGSAGYDNRGENLYIRARSEDWYLAVKNGSICSQRG